MEGVEALLQGTEAEEGALVQEEVRVISTKPRCVVLSWLNAWLQVEGLEEEDEFSLCVSCYYVY